MKQKQKYYKSLLKDCKSCKDCGLHQSRNNVVVGRTLITGETNLDARVMIIGEAPGYWEDKDGLPFVGKSGELLQDIIDFYDLTGKVFITNIVKCRPPDNRDPEPSEIEACRKYLMGQIRIIKPSMIIGLGKHSARFLLNGIEVSMKDAVLVPHEFTDSERGLSIPTRIIYHPATMLYRKDKEGYDDFRKFYKQQWDDAKSLFDSL